MTQQAGDFVWFELLTNDVDASVAHYTEVLGWKPRTMDMGDFEYKMLGRNDKGHCGVVKPQQRDVPSHWSAYIAVENVDATAAKVEKAGGKVLVPPTDLPSVGRFALIADPEGATLNIFAANDRENASTGFHWTELWCQEPKKTLAFYEAVLGAKVETMQMPFGDYYTLSFGGDATGGAMKAPSPKIPAHWLPYALVDDPDAAAERARSHGGALQGEVMNVDGVGRFAVLRAPNGAVLGVIKPAAA